MPIKRYVYLITTLALPLALMASCGGGGGGGGDEFIGAAEVNINASPNEIDTGDRTQLSIRIRQVHENGIALKVRYPVGLTYVPASAVLSVDGIELDATPTVNTTVDTAVYLVFYFSQSVFGDEIEGTLSLQLEGAGEITDGQIEVDPDVDDPDKPNSSEFDSAAPEFGAEDMVDIKVVD